MIRTRRGFLNKVLRTVREEGCSAAYPHLSLWLQLPFLCLVWMFNVFVLSECNISIVILEEIVSRYCCVLYFCRIF